MENQDCLDDSSTLLVLDGENAKILAVSTDGFLIGTVLEKCGGTPDGIALDKTNRHIYWTNMGEFYHENDGWIERIDFDGNNRTIIVPKGKTFTPKQIKLDLENGHLYWCDREGMRVMRSNLDGNFITTLVEAGITEDDREDEQNHCVGIAIDIEKRHLYWTQKGPSKGGKGRIFRAGLDLPKNMTAQTRTDIELLWKNLPEPIDLDFDASTGFLYWSDRGAAPKGNTINRADVNALPLMDPEILSGALDEAIGIALDLKNERIFFGDLGGHLYCRRLSSTSSCLLFRDEGRFTGIAFLDEKLQFQ